MIIRESKKDDLNQIITLHKAAFGEPEGNEIALLIRNMFKDKTAKPLTSLIIENNETIVGHILFSFVTIESAQKLKVSILAPLAISKQHQHKGYGKMLITSGLDALRNQNMDIVLVLGDPKYYGRFGFHTEHSIQAPHPLEHPEA